MTKEIGLQDKGLPTPRQLEVLALRARGFSNKGIARVLGLCEYTVHNIASQTYERIGVTNGFEAIYLCCKRGLLQ